MRIIIAVILLLASFAAAHALGLGREGRVFGKLGASPKNGTAAAGPATPCSGTGLIFTSACNSQYIGIL